MKNLIRKILRESDFEWTDSLEAHDDNVYLALMLIRYDEDSEGHIPWVLHLYVPRSFYLDVTGDFESKPYMETWNVEESVEGKKFLKYFYDEGFDKKQPEDVIVDFEGVAHDASFMPVNKDYFCDNVGGYHPDKCGR